MPSVVYRKKTEAIPTAGDDLDFQIFCADRLAAVCVTSLSLGGRGKPRSFRFRARFARGVYVSYSVIRQQVPKPMTGLAFEGEA